MNILFALFRPAVSRRTPLACRSSTKRNGERQPDNSRRRGKSLTATLHAAKKRDLSSDNLQSFESGRPPRISLSSLFTLTVARSRDSPRTADFAGAAPGSSAPWFIVTRLSSTKGRIPADETAETLVETAPSWRYRFASFERHEMRG